MISVLRSTELYGYARDNRKNKEHEKNGENVL